MVQATKDKALADSELKSDVLAQVAFEFTRDDWPELRRRTRWLNQTYVHWIYLGCYCLPILILACWTDWISILIPSLILIAVFYRRVVAPVLFPQEYNLPDRFEYLVAIEKDALRIDSQYSSTRYAPWVIDSVKERDDMLLICYCGQRWILGIPFSAFASVAARDEFTNHLRKLWTEASRTATWDVDRDLEQAELVATFQKEPPSGRLMNVLAWALFAFAAVGLLGWIATLHLRLPIILLGAIFFVVCGSLLTTALKFFGLVARHQSFQTKIEQSEQRFAITDRGFVTSTAAGYHVNWWEAISEAVHRQKAIHVVDFMGQVITPIPEDSFDDPEAFLEFDRVLREKIYASPVASRLESELTIQSPKPNDVGARLVNHPEENPYAPPETLAAPSPQTPERDDHNEVRIVEFTVTEEDIRHSVGKHHTWIASIIAMAVVIATSVLCVYEGFRSRFLLWNPWIAVLGSLGFVAGVSLATQYGINVLLRPRMLKRILSCKLMGPGRKRIAILGSSVWIAANGQSRSIKLANVSWKKSFAKAIGLEHKSELLVIPETAVSEDDYRYLQSKLRPTMR